MLLFVAHPCKRELGVNRLDCVSWLYHETQLRTLHALWMIWNVEEPSYSTECLGLVAIRTEGRDRKAENLLFP